MRVAFGLFSWSMAAGLLAFSSRQFALTIKHGPFFVRFTLCCLPEQAWRAAYAARGAKRLVHNAVHLNAFITSYHKDESFSRA